MLINGAGLDQGHINRVQVSAAHPFGHKAQGHVHVFYLSFVDGVSKVRIGLIGHTALQDTGAGEQAVEIVSQGGPGIDGEVQLLPFLGLHGKRFGHFLGVTGEGKSGHAQGHSRFYVAGCFPGRTDLSEQ